MIMTTIRVMTIIVVSLSMTLIIIIDQLVVVLVTKITMISDRHDGGYSDDYNNDVYDSKKDDHMDNQQ